MLSSSWKLRVLRALGGGARYTRFSSVERAGLEAEEKACWGPWLCAKGPQQPGYNKVAHLSDCSAFLTAISSSSCSLLMLVRGLGGFGRGFFSGR